MASSKSPAVSDDVPPPLIPLKLSWMPLLFPIGILVLFYWGDEMTEARATREEGLLVKFAAILWLVFGSAVRKWRTDGALDDLRRRIGELEAAFSAMQVDRRR